MVSQISPIEQIKQLIHNGENFLLSGGAGSGKTYTLMEVLDFLYARNPKSRIACITYTNVAVKEIRERAPYKSLWASTIHEFLWESIRMYQRELKSSLVELVDKEKQESGTGIKYKGTEEITLKYFSDKKINYKEWVKIEKGEISHDEVLKIANFMFGKYPLLCKILNEKYDFILMDEYQDAEEQVIDVFLDYLQKKRMERNVVGFFGDSMQSIYDNGIGDLQKYITVGNVREVVKPDNWRCPKTVTDLINKVRNDGLKQEPIGKNKYINGTITFLYSNKTDIDIETVKSHRIFQDWNFEDSAETKELYLTHNLISKKAGFDELFQIYAKDRIIEHVQKIKKKLTEEPGLESIITGKTLGEVLELNLVSESGPFNQFIVENKELFELAQRMPFEELRNIYLNKDQLIEGGSEKKEDRGDNKDNLIKHLTKIQKCIHLYNENSIYEFTKATEFRINSIADKKFLKEIMDELKNIEGKSIEEIIELANEKGIVKKDNKLSDFIRGKRYVFDRVKKVKSIEFKNLYDFEEGYSPYSTQHGIKGAEFENVFVILDNGGWNQYNFRYLFEETGGKESIIKRTRKMFYVSCSRAKKNLVVFYFNPSNHILEKAKKWFGEGNVLTV